MHHRVKAGALQLTTFIATVIFIIIWCLFLLVKLQAELANKTDLLYAQINLLDSAFSIPQLSSGILNDPTEHRLDDSSIRAERSIEDAYWGGYGLRKVSVTREGKKLKKAALLGGELSDNNSTALSLDENSAVLHLLGDSFIDGDVNTSEAGVRPGIIAGYHFTGKELLSGTVNTMGGFPELEASWLSYIQKLQTMSLPPFEKALSWVPQQETINSFNSSPLVFMSYKAIYLRNETLKGNLIIYSKESISVDASCILEDIILVAPRIHIKSYFKGTLQAIASKSILIDDHTSLNYPSSLIVNSPLPTESDEDSFISMGLNTSLNGMLVYYNPRDFF
jgi:hypothetical protein